MAIEPRITGTFLDEITHDIPSQNWSLEEWRREFDLYTHIGIDTLIIIRAGYRDRCIFPAKAVPGLLPTYDDLARTFFDLADERKLNVFFGLFDSGTHWLLGRWEQEADLNKAFVEEVAERYGGHESFAGWYICHETSRNENNIIDLIRELGSFCKSTKDLPVLVSPYPRGRKQFGAEDVLSAQETVEAWDFILSETQGAVDICAFQDGQIDYRELPALLSGMAEVGKRRGLTIWSNVETFDRDVAWRFPPADWRNLRYKLEEAAKQMEKIITFEFPHFMSPHSCYPSAHNLYRRYCEFAGLG